MARRDKPKRSKAYRPRPVSQVGGLFAIGGQHVAAEDRRPMSNDQITDLEVAYRLAFHDMINGRATEENWCVCVCSLNIALVLAERGLGEEYIPALNTALEDAFRAKIRAGRTGKWGFDGDAIQAIKDAFAVHEEQIKLAMKQEIRDALHEVYRRADEGNVFREAA